MAHTLVVVLLLDTITDIPAGFDKTADNTNNSRGIPEHVCGANIADSIINTANREFGLNIRNTDHGTETEKLFDDKRNGNSLAVDDYKFDNSQLNSIQRDGEYFEQSELYEDNAIEERFKSNESSTLPDTTPFLVAIFETLSNVTANTCAGTLLSPHWVLTSTKCINVLEYLRRNGTNITEPSLYTVIAETSNPLIDGTAHNVTQVIFHPDYQTSNSSRSRPTLAMMRINPGVEGGGLDLISEGISSNLRAFGWVYLQNDSNPLMKSVSIPVKIQPELKKTSLAEDMCFITNDSEPKILEHISQLSWGSPVLQVLHRRARVVAVTHASERVLTATPVYPHASWVQSVINNY